MLKIDEDKTREAVRSAIASFPFDDDPNHKEYAELMRRSAAAQAEIVIFCMKEIERDPDNPVDGFQRIAAVIANATFSQMTQIRDENDPESMQPTHDMIHVMCDGLSAALHSHYYQVADISPEDRAKLIKEVPVVRREVGDA